jgi:hypothetical protein
VMRSRMTWQRQPGPDGRADGAIPDFAEITLGRADGATRGLHPGYACLLRARFKAETLQTLARREPASKSGPRLQQ